jgi:formate hydrogenlyase transcriptional activator
MAFRKKAKTMNVGSISGRFAEFEHYLLDVSNRLVAAPLSGLGGEIDAVLSDTASFWSLDTALLYDKETNQGDFRLSHSCTRPDPSATPSGGERHFLEWALTEMSRGKPVSTTDFGKRGAGRKGTAGSGKTASPLKSGVAIPLKVDNVTRGCLAVFGDAPLAEDVTDLVGVLTDLGEMLAGALERKRSGNLVYNHLQFEMLLSDISATYINIGLRDVEKVIRNHLGRLARFFEANRCALYIFDKESGLFRTDAPLIWWPTEDDGVLKGLQEWFQGQPDMHPHFRYYFDTWRKGEPLEITSLDSLPPEADVMKRFYEKFGVKSALSIPLHLEGAPVAALVITDTRREHRWPQELIPRLRLCGEVFANALVRKQTQEALDKAFFEIEELKDRFETDYLYLREEMAAHQGFADVIGESIEMKGVLDKARQVASTNATVLLLGETGTGKGLIARTIHQLSSRADRPLIQVNCAALSPQLIESELFGHERGAFTGATTRRQGRFELARGTTLFLDEIGDLPLDLQAKLLRVLQDGEFERVGGSDTLKSDARVIAATNKELEKETEEGRFRRDLWYRLSVFPIRVPSLRERIGDIPLLVGWFVSKHGRANGKRFASVPVRTMKSLQTYSWPGNVRELENTIERAVITSRDGHLVIDVPTENGANGRDGRTLAHVEMSHIVEVLNSRLWVIEGPKGAARVLGLHPATLRSRMKKLGIHRP